MRLKMAAGWKKIIGAGSVRGEKQWPKWCKWDALGIKVGKTNVVGFFVMAPLD